MIRRPVVASLLAILLAPAIAVGAAPGQGTTAAAQVTAAEAAPFLGDWTLAMEGPNGPGTFNLSLKVEGEKVVGEIESDVVGTQKFTSISRREKGLFLNYSFPYEAMTVDAVVSLTPDTDGKVAAQIDFAGGAYTMTGTATRKEKPMPRPDARAPRS